MCQSGQARASWDRVRARRPHSIVSLSRSLCVHDPETSELYTLSLHGALPISRCTGPRSRRTGGAAPVARHAPSRSEEHTSELQSRVELVCRPLLEKKKLWRGMQTHRNWMRYGTADFIPYVVLRREV